MNGSYLLDTNIIIALFGRDPDIEFQLGRADVVFVPAIVLGELFYGSYKSTRVEENLGRIEAFAAQSAIMNCDTDTARHYGRLKDSLRRKGKPLPENDIWIAALAVQHEMKLVSRDAHFTEVDELIIESW